MKELVEELLKLSKEKWGESHALEEVRDVKGVLIAWKCKRCKITYYAHSAKDACVGWKIKLNELINQVSGTTYANN